ncbi:MAG: nucleotidyltransferase domain-containing protein [bacterium]
MEIASKEIIQAMVDRIVELFHPEQVILFGSYAQGNPTLDSDVDLLVVMPLKERKIDAMWKIRNSLRDFDFPMDIIVSTPDEIRRFGKLIGSILHPALQEGRVVYAQT